MTDAPDGPLTLPERAAFVLAGAFLLVVFRLHLVPTLLAGFLTSWLLHGMARRLRGDRISHGLARALSATVLGLVAGGAVAAIFVLLHGFVRGRVGDLPGVLESIGDTLARLRGTLERAGIYLPLPSADGSTAAVGAWLKEHAAALRRAGTAGARGFVHALLGTVLGVLVFFRASAVSRGPLASALTERVRRFADAFRKVFSAQIEISAVNTALTAAYLLAGLPLFGVRLPLAGTLVALTFVCGLVPVAGNLVSNSVVVLVSLGVSAWVALASLVFLVVIHKLEYVLNAKIVGGRIGAAAWETLAVIVLFEAAFGVPGVILAPVVYAWAKDELRERGLV